MYVCAGGRLHTTAHVKVGRQFSLHLPHESWGPTQSHQAWWQAPLLAEPSYWLNDYFFQKNQNYIDFVSWDIFFKWTGNFLVNCVHLSQTNAM